MVKVFEGVKIHHYRSGNNWDRHGLRNNADELNIYRLFLNANNCFSENYFSFLRV